MNREDWLNAAIPLLAHEVFKRDLPEVFVSTGWTGTRSGLKAVGSCFVHPVKKHIFISPVIQDSIRTLDILCHELIHALEPGAGHKAPFKAIAKAIGLTGKMTATVAGPELTARLGTIVERLGPYPHEKLDPALGRKKQSTRLVKLECPDCGYIVRTTQTWLDCGLPVCCCGTTFKQPEQSESEDS